MAINKKLIHFKKYSDFNSKKLSANENNTAYTVGVSGSVVTGSPEVLFQTICWIQDERKMWTHGTLYDCSGTDLSDYLTAGEIAELYAEKEALAEVATSGSYNDLSDKPSIPGAVTESTVSGWGFTKNTGTYSKPGTGIPKTDLASAVQTSLGKADTALQSYTETDPVFKASAAAGITSSDITNWNGKTSNTGTITGIKMNGTSKGTSGVVDLGTVITAHQDISGKLDAATAASTYATKTELGDVQTQIDTLVSGDASSAIESFNEITAFLAGVEDTETLDGIIAGINTEIAKKADKSSAITGISRSGTTFTATRADGTTFTFTQQDSDTKVTSVGNHYTPAEDTGAAISAASGTATNITGTAGKLNVVTGVKRDAKGHIVGVTSANIYSTDNNTTYSSKTAASGGTDVSLVTTGEKYLWNSKTSNTGTITGIKMNGASKGTSGVVDLGTVITAHQDISGKQDKLVSGTSIKTINGESLLGAGNIGMIWATATNGVDYPSVTIN